MAGMNVDSGGTEQHARIGASPSTETWSLIGLSAFQATLLLVGSLTALRIALLFAADHNLGPDEAQYWSWAKDLDLGYFSKPPMIAWVIAATTAVFGDGEAAVRLASPLFHMGTALLIFVLARDLYDHRVAFWSALTYATVPAVWFSSGLITTDVPLLFFWSLALLALHRTLSERSLGWALLLGVSLGLGLLSKYAMLYFLMCAGLFLARAAEHRWLLWSRPGLIAGAVGVLLFSPNILWNMTHDFSTVAHTAENAKWWGQLFEVGGLFAFLGAQFGVFGPILFVGLIWGLVKRQARGRASDRYLLAFVLPVILLVAAQAWVSRAHANWAATAYAAGTILVVAWLSRIPIGRRVIPASIGLHTVLGLGLSALILYPALADALGRGQDFKRIRGWDRLGALVVQEIGAAEESPYSAILADDRHIHAELRYYARSAGLPVVNWDHDGVPQNHFEFAARIREDQSARVLWITRMDSGFDRITRHFDRHRFLRTVTDPLGSGRNRVVHLYDLRGYHERFDTR